MRGEELRAATAGRADWQVNGSTGVYTPPGGDWSARVRAVDNPDRATRAWHIAILQAGVARHTRPSGAAVEAVRWAERMVATCLAATPSNR